MQKRYFSILALPLGIGIVTTCLFTTPGWALSGKLINNSGSPLTGATVKLLVANKDAITESDGHFTIADPTIPVVGLNGNSVNTALGMLLKGTQVSFTLAQAGGVDLSVYSLAGIQLGKVHDQAQAGSSSIDFGPMVQNQTTGVYVVVLRTSSAVHTFHYLKFNGEQSTASNRGNTQSVRAIKKDAVSAIDTLLISYTQGDVTSTRKVLVYGYGDSINTYQSNGQQILIIDPSNDNDGDGLTNYEERYVYFTNAELFDTDGDGVSDYQEIQDNRNPLVADVPDFSFTAISYPVMVATYSKSVTEQTDRTISTGGDYSESSAFTSSQELNWSAELAIMVGGEYSWGKDGGAKVSGSITGTVGTGGSVSFSQERSTSMSKNWDDAQTYSKSVGTTFSGGTIAMELLFTNNTSQEIILDNPVMRLTTKGTTNSTLSTQIGEMSLESGTQVDIPAKIGNTPGTQKRIFTATINNPDLFDLIAKQSNGLTVQLQNVRFVSSLAGMDTLMNNVYNRTTLVNVDFGYYKPGETLVKKYVAARNRYNDFYTTQQDRYVSASLADVIKTVNVNATTGVNNEIAGIQSIDGLANGDVTKGSWGVVTQNRTEADSVTVYSTSASYDPANITVSDKSVVTVVYSADADSDGLPDRLEMALGTDYKNPDSDNDGLTDGQEVFGWKAAGQDTVWKTNPLRYDTDNDGLSDKDDSDPLKALVNPQDSLVLVNGISLTPLQGSTWSQAVSDQSAALTYNVNTIFRGPVNLKITMDHPIYMMMILRGTTDTLTVFNPTNDATITYTSKVPLVLGSNTIQLKLFSKNGASEQTITLNGINRRLIQVDPTNQSFFKVSGASSVANTGVENNIYVNVDSLKTLDSLVQGVMLLRTDISAIPLDASAKAQQTIAQDLGDAGNGYANLAEGNTPLGKATTANTYHVVKMLASTSQTVQNSDSTVKRANDFVYFPYTYNVDASKASANYYTAPSTGSGIYLANERTIVLDSFYVMMVQKAQYTGGYDWQFLAQFHFQLKLSGVLGTTYNDQRTSTGTIGTNNPKTVGVRFVDFTNFFASGGTSTDFSQNFNVSDSILCQPYNVSEVWYRAVNFIQGWQDYGPIPSNLSYRQIVYPETYSVDANFSYQNYSVGSLTDSLWIHHEYNTVNVNVFDDGFKVKWHFKYGTKKQGGS